MMGLKRFNTSLFRNINTKVLNQNANLRGKIQNQIRNYSMPNEPKARTLNSMGPVSLVSLAIFLGTGAGLYYYLVLEKENLEKEKLLRKKQSESSIGKPRIGGKFQLEDANGNSFTEQNLLGKFSLLYFGFTHCPDICPDELDKISEIIQFLEKDSKIKDEVQPIFITCDPMRDNGSVIKTYLEDFHPKFVGLTGSLDQIATACKAYRVYFSKPPKINPGEDYLVDHSIFFYLMGPDGQFINCYGKDKLAKEAYYDIKEKIAEYNQLN